MDEKNIAYEVVDGEAVPVSETNPKRFDINGKDNAFKIIIAVCSALLAVFGIFDGFRMGFTITSITLFTALTVYLAGAKTRFSFFGVICGLINLITATSFTITSNGGIRFLTVLSMVILSATWFVSLSANINKKSDFALLSYIFVPFAQSFTVNLPKSLKAVFSSRPKKRWAFGKALLGFILAVPVLMIVLPLLILSDEAFSGLVTNLLKSNIFTVFEVLVGLIIGFFIFSYCLTLKKREVYEGKSIEMGAIDSTILVSFLSVISVCYFAYLFSQLAYFFDAFKGILPKDYSFTFAEYARRGFFEMCIIAVINFVIISLVILFARKKDGKLSAGLKTLCSFVGFFTLVIINTALSKMFLYIKSYGMTELRITTSAFMVFLEIVFLSLLLKLFFKRVRVLRAAIVTAACVLTVLGTVNMNFVIANYNYNAYKSGALKEMDVNTIYKMGDEGVPYLVKLTKDENAEVSSAAESKLQKIIDSDKYYKTKVKEEIDIEGFKTLRVYEIEEKKYDGVGKYSISRDKVYEALDKYIEENGDALVREEYF